MQRSISCVASSLAAYDSFTIALLVQPNSDILLGSFSFLSTRLFVRVRRYTSLEKQREAIAGTTESKHHGIPRVQTTSQGLLISFSDMEFSTIGDSSRTQFKNGRIRSNIIAPFSFVNGSSGQDGGEDITNRVQYMSVFANGLKY